MLVYEKLGEGGSGNRDIPERTPNIPTDIRDTLEKLGFQMDDETFSRIDRANQKDTFVQDLSAALINPSEKGRIEQLYLKGFGQVVDTPYGPLSFVEIQKHPKKDEILSGLKPSKQAKFNEWEQQAVIEKKKEKIDYQQAVIETKKEKIDYQQAVIETANHLNESLKDSTDSIRNLKSLPSDIEIKAIEAAKQNPPKELAGIPPEEYSQFSHVILADYSISHANEISKSLDTDDKNAFKTSIDKMSDIIGRKPANWPEIVEAKGGLVLGEKREEIRSLGEKYIREGYNESVVWDSQSRSLIFRGKDGEKIIDTAPVPPMERITLSGISISREADIPPPSPTLASHQKIERSIISEIDTMSQSPLIVNTSIDSKLKQNMEKNFEEVDRIPDTKGKLNATHQALGYKKLALENLIKTKTEDGEIAESNALKGTLDIVNRQIQDVGNMAMEYEKSLITQEKIQANNQDDDFDTIARKNLGWLTSADTLFQRMGGDANIIISRIIRNVNTDRTPNNRIDLSRGALSLSDKELLKEQYQKIGGTLDTLKDADKLQAFQKKISNAINKSPDHPESIEGLLRGEKGIS